MSAQLVKLMKEVIIREGSTGRMKLALAAGRGEKMIERYLKGTSAPGSDVVYRIAKACGCSDKDALALASKASNERAKETA